MIHHSNNDSVWINTRMTTAITCQASDELDVSTCFLFICLTYIYYSLAQKTHRFYLSMNQWQVSAFDVCREIREATYFLSGYRRKSQVNLLFLDASDLQRAVKVSLRTFAFLLKDGSLVSLSQASSIMRYLLSLQPHHPRPSKMALAILKH